MGEEQEYCEKTYREAIEPGVERARSAAESLSVKRVLAAMVFVAAVAGLSV